MCPELRIDRSGRHRRTVAIEPALESLRIWRELAPADPASALPCLADALHRAAIVHLRADQEETGLALFGEAAAVYVDLPEEHGPRAASCLYGYGNILLICERPARAPAPLIAALAMCERYGLAELGMRVSDLRRQAHRSHPRHVERCGPEARGAHAATGGW